MTIHKRLKMYTVTAMLIGALLMVGNHELQVRRRAKRNAVTRVYLGPRQWRTQEFCPGGGGNKFS